MKNTEQSLRCLLNDWNPIGVASQVDDEYDCLINPLLSRLIAGADSSEIGAFLRYELVEHFGLRAEHKKPDHMADRLMDWWKQRKSPVG